ncbi:MAG TPA: transposase [Williamwhitmania sp.]|nr:transposase [Williamwhitmania sp.]
MAYNPEKHHRRSIRLKGYDYARAGLYFITLCCQNRACLFGNIENGVMVLNEYGHIACNEWMKTTEIRNNVELGEFVIMPNHIHGIVRLLGRGELDSPNKQGVCDTPLRSPSQTIGAIVRGYKSSVTKQLGLLGFNEKIWQRNYHEHIIRDEQSYMKISDYIINNPANWDRDSLK